METRWQIFIDTAGISAFKLENLPILRVICLNANEAIAPQSRKILQRFVW